MGTPADSETFGATLRRFRLAADLTQADLAALAGLSVRGVHTLESGDVRPRRETAERLARALRLDDNDRAQFMSAGRPRPRRWAKSRLAIGVDAPRRLACAESRSPRLLIQLRGLPNPVSGFVGREREIEQVRRLLLDRRLVVLTGAGGCGKTRLAIEVAAGLRDHFMDGICLVALASLGDPYLVETAVIHALGLEESPHRSQRATLELALRDRELLLVLDTFEHLLDAAPLVGGWLELCPKLTVLVTSRAPLGLLGEQVYPVPSMALPDDASRADTSEAVRLFVERAGSVRPGFALTEANTTAVAEICRQVDGLPLAIELAAAWAWGLDPEQIAARLDDRLGLLVRGSRAAPPRHRTLRDTLDWSYALLSDDERSMLRCLGVFVGGWTLEAAEAVCATEAACDKRSSDEERGMRDSARTSPLAVLVGLVEKSLVVMEEVGGGSRYRLLDTVREYALEKLHEAGEEAAVRDRHRDWLLAFAERAASELNGPQQARWLDRLEAEHGNLRAALRWCLERPDASSGLRFGALLWRFWEGRNHLQEGRAWLDRVLALDCAAVEPVRVCWAVFAAGRMAFLQGDREIARRLLESCLAQARDLGDRALVAGLLTTLGHLARDRGDLDQARAHYDETQRIWRARNDERGTAIALQSLGRLAVLDGRIDEGVDLLEASLSQYRAVGELTDVTRVLLTLGAAACDLGRLGEARAHYVEGLQIAVRLRDRGRMAANLGGCAQFAALQAQPERAVLLAAIADTLSQATGTVLAVDEQRRFDAMIEPMRRALGAARCTELAQRARRMTIEQAVAYALEDEHPRPGEDGQPVADEEQRAALTPREWQVAVLIGSGLTNQQIAAELVLSKRTVEWYISTLFGKLGMRSRGQVAAWAARHDPGAPLLQSEA